MEFRLIYKGKLKGNGSPKQKQEIRRCFHSQLVELWKQPPLLDYIGYLPGGNYVVDSPFEKKVDSFTFRSLVISALDVVAELEITFLRPEAPGILISNSGDIDNRIKTLLDALRMPHTKAELPNGDQPAADENPFCVLLEDDRLITHLSITTDRLLEPNLDPQEVFLIIKVKIKLTRATIDNLGLGA